MPKRSDLKSILLIGSGPIVIGQACEFDYSGTQAVKALKEEGYKVILINSNPATIMTDPDLADVTYIEPITADFVEKIVEKEKPCAVLPTLGGQTALNVTLECEERGVFQKHGVELIGASGDAIRAAEDRDKFKDIVTECGLESARSSLVSNMDEARTAVAEIGYPLILRPSRTMGGSGGAIVENESEFETKVNWAFECSPVSEVLIEESLVGWKEFELELMRDKASNAVVVCSIENLDPMGIHTGDSVTVAPVQTLTDKEYQHMRDSAIKLMNAIGVETGGSNVQFGVCPETGRQIVIELNPRVSRSSALASKATGFPIAKIAAKLSVGYTLDELPNDITKKTPACFEPTIDYVVVKIPRFTFEKFSGTDESLGTQMKSVGEAMAIGGTFAEALQKACRSLEVDRVGLLGHSREQKYQSKGDLVEKLKELNSERLYLASRFLELGGEVSELCSITSYDPWFVNEIDEIVEAESYISGISIEEVKPELIYKMKALGSSDIRLSQLFGCSEEEVFQFREKHQITPSFKSVDTCAAEFESYTPYLYSTYQESSDPLVKSDKKKIAILGGGPNRIGQGLEFDYCCVHASFSLVDAGMETIMINCNPETVSTDYDTSSILYFEPLTLEDVWEILRFDSPDGVIVQYGGQTPLKLALDLKERGAKVIGTSPEAIEQSEDRELFRDLAERTGVKQPKSEIATKKDEAVEKASRLGYPLMVRPSFVLGGRAMAIISNDEDLKSYVEESVLVSEKRPLLLDRFLDNAVEVDVDALCDGKDVVICGIVEHIERAGVHSGDSSFVMPTQTLSDSILEEIVSVTKRFALNGEVHGLMNVQYAVSDGELYILELNPRASRSVPFVSKVLGVPWAKVAARVMAGSSLAELNKSGEFGEILDYSDYLNKSSSISYIAVKEAVFPFSKFKGFDARLGPEMRSTGEVMGIAKTTGDGFWRSQQGSGITLPLDGKVFFSLKDSDKKFSLDLAKRMEGLGFTVVATKGTASFFSENGIQVEVVNKVREGSPHVVDMLESGEISLVINTPEGTGPLLDSAAIRSTAIAMRIPLFTTVSAAEAGVDAIEFKLSKESQEAISIQDHLASGL